MGRTVTQLDLIGQSFNRLTVIEQTKHRYWKCLCECGNDSYIIRQDHLVKGDMKDCGCTWRVTEREGAVNLLYAQYRNGAERRGFSFDLSKDEFIKLISGNCGYCGGEPNQIFRNTRSKYELTYNGIDRINNNFGYNVDNCIPCCKFCNRAKHAEPLDEFLAWIERLKRNEVNLNGLYPYN